MKGSFEMPPLKEKPRVAVIGQGAREHTIVWKLAASPLEPKLYSIPGNPGMWTLSTAVDLPLSDIDGLVQWATANTIDLVVVGPEQPLAAGLVDRLQQVGIPAFGPVQAAAQIEASKAFSKELMKAAGVPTAAFDVFTQADKAFAYASTLGLPVVIKADGLAAGKGVVMAQTLKEADSAIRDMLEGNRFGTSGHKVVVEECLVGEEVSLMYFVDAHTAVPMLPARDFKRIGDGDTGPNTGGMGAFAPVPTFVDAGVIETVTETVVTPVLESFRVRDIVYRGVLYVGLMMTADGPKVIEFNARFGDPETEVVLPLLESDLLEVMWAVANDKLAEASIHWRGGACVCVVLAGADYPAGSDKGTPIRLTADMPSDTVIFHAGTAMEAGQLVTAGGRVMTISAVADDIPSATSVAYQRVDLASFKGMQYRTDIAYNWQR